MNPNKSVWSDTVTFKEYPSLDKDLNADVLIIGAGLTGILTSYLLKQSGIDSVIIEADRVGFGITRNTTAKITSQHYLIYNKLIKDVGFEKAKQYADANQTAIEKFKEIVKNENIQCDFEIRPSYCYSTKETEIIDKEVAAANRVGIDAEFVDNSPLPFEIKSAVKFNNQAQFNPLKFMEPLTKDLTIYEKTKAYEIEDNIVTTNNGKIKAGKIIVATHYPYINAPGYYFARMHQERSYVLALENAPNYDGMYIDIENNGYTFRNYQNLLLFGGASHRTGENEAGDNYKKLRDIAKLYYPESKEVYAWSNQDCITLDAVPYIGLYANKAPDLYVATGYNTWGMTSSMVAGMILTDMIGGKENPNAEVFSPQRFTIKPSFKSFLSEGAKAVSGLASQNLTFPKTEAEELPRGHGGIVEYQGDKVGVYKNDNGDVFAVDAKCTHLGCQLKWNADEKTWDCPCHGSRFDYEGKVINNPALQDLKRYN